MITFRHQNQKKQRETSVIESRRDDDDRMKNESYPIDGDSALDSRKRKRKDAFASVESSCKESGV
jgi:hypothetical protein